jgi:hypothetical protein
LKDGLEILSQTLRTRNIFLSIITKPLGM